MSLEPPHDYLDPQSYLNALEAASLAVDVRSCHWCVVKTEPVEGTGNGWLVESTHEAHCPEHEDNQSV